ncbi:hypothetical protein CHLNCDRAFT_140055 [Chlorella variabilis]|uniref:Uncharacterized protein n=1 Tax=Chlorella variabilis TaxID=554065 RepID=E1ZRH6_CHLVA|nr:hypothetical protein CHLNCDRAFT_140055 [Chlorella variabilis]EFN51630.1 hypothetical protein CHLNCDRAFT_140055 [Chlorella variabilis]|eukprot:XP_005843732.1 hypothetical protein CHLNCDRAFT_140055 [Chlorella variabilis]
MAVEPAVQHAAAVEEEEEAEHSDEEELESSSSGGSDPSDSLEGGTKKRKKKKKKKKGGGAAGGGGGAAAQPAVDPAARKEGERRLQARRQPHATVLRVAAGGAAEAVEVLSHNSEDGMWVKLSGCHLADGKMKKLCEALQANTICISLDLSANQLTDEGAKALAAALADGRAPDLIDLDLRDNLQIQEGGTLALEELQQQRKTLRVALGPSQPPPQQQAAAAGSKPQAPAAGQQQQQQQQQLQQQQHANGSGGGGSLADTVKSNPVISKYFQVGNDEAEEAEEAHQQGSPHQAGGAGEEHLGGLSAAELARILWDQLEQCLDAPRPDIPAVSEPLRAIAEQVEHEMDNCALPMLASTEVGELKTFTQWALRKLHVLHSVLDLVPPPILTPYSKTVPVPAVGTHRAAVAELLAQLLRGECASIAQRVAASGLLRRCAAIAVDHPNCSAVHGAVARCLRLSLSKAVGHVGLWQQLLGSAPVAAAAGAASHDRGGSLNLAVEAVAIAAAAAAAPTVGKRAANAGFALAIGRMLHQAATGEALGGDGGAAEAAAADAADAAAAAADAAAAENGTAGEGVAQQPDQQQQQQEQEQEQQQQRQEQEQEQGGGEAAGGGTGEAGPARQPGPAADAPAGQLGGDPLAEPNPLAPPPGARGLRRTPSQPSLAKVASHAVADLPEEEEPWEVLLQAQLATADPWVEFSTGPDCLLRRMLEEHVGDLGGPRPRPGAPPPGEEEEDGAGQGQVISGQELLMMLRGLNLGGFSGGI